MLDSGASDHFVKDKTLLTNFVEEKSFIWLADNSKVECPGYGTLFWKTTEINGKDVTIKLKGVRVIPNLHQNILSLSSIFQQYQNATEIRRDDNNILLKIRNNEILFKLTDNLFKNLVKSDSINLSVVKTTNLVTDSINLDAVKTTKENISIEKLRNEHLKMAHLNSQDLASALRSQGFKISNKIIKDFICEDCLKTKSTIKRPEQTGRIAGENTTPGSFIHSDIAGPEPAYNNKNFMINFIDDATGATYVKFIKSKSDVPKAIKEFLQESKTDVFKLPVNDNTTFHSDGEAIYKSKNVKEILDEENIYQNFSQNYHPQQNGMAEKTYRTIFGDARAMLTSSPLPTNFYPLAIEHAVLLRNLLPKGERKLSAYEFLTKKSPKEIISQLHIFGSTIYVHNSSNEVKKMQEKAFVGVYIGYDIKSKSHKIFNPTTGKITTSINVRIDDNSMTSGKIEKIKFTSTEKIVEDVREEVLPQDEALSAPDPIKINIPAVPDARDTLPETKEYNELEIINVATTKEKDTSIPKNISHAFKCDESDMWIKSTFREVDAMIENNVWIVPDSIPKNAKIINSIMVYRKKEDVEIEDKELLYKSRLVILGNLQEETQFDPNKISSPVMTSTTSRALFAKAAIKEWKIHHLDVITAYLNSPLPESDVIYMGLPKKIVEKGYPLVVQLRKAVYGLR